LAPGSGSLPAGLIPNPVTGVISGSPVDGGTYTFTVRCFVSPGQTATKQFTITILNPLPVITSLSPSARRAGLGGFELTVYGTGFVASSDVNWNSSERPTTYISATELRAQIAAVDTAATGTAWVSVLNPEPNGGTSNAVTFTILPPNSAPEPDAGGPYEVAEGSSVTLTATATDPEGDALSVAWDLDKDGVFETAGAEVEFAGVDGPFGHTVRVQAADPEGLTGVSETTVTVLNIPPTVGPITGPTEPHAVGASLTFSASFTDPGIFDTHTALWDWGDGTTMVQVGAVSPVAASHSYATPGVYTVNLTVTDKDGGVGYAPPFEYVVVYDPAGGFVTGGGWIMSPAGADVDHAAATGKATFGFNSKYKTGATLPAGQTQFQFKAGDLNFHSESYEWLVVAGAKAQYKGVGTINGVGSYGFMLSAIDSDVNANDSHTLDRFRIRIWGQSGLVYDNQIGAEENADPTTALGGGSIVIHKP
jgi:PKD repeat protein